MADRIWSEKELDRRSLRGLSILRHAEEVSGSVAANCRYYGISRNVLYTWKRRYDAGGLEGLRIGRASRITARMPRPRRWWARSSTCMSSTTSGRTRSRCT
jgi:transposase